ncbi:MAG: GNAT family N-acetyltransferase [Sandaracinaceae bacterium]
MSAQVRQARPEDAGAMHALVVALAEYERASHEVVATADDLARALGGPAPRLFGHVAERDGRVVGFAVWFYTYSTWLGRHGIWLEDLFVLPEHRGLGIGKALLVALARRCVAEGLGRLEWNVLDWNEPALAFYRAVGAVPLQEWTVHRLAGDALLTLAAQPPPRA